MRNTAKRSAPQATGTGSDIANGFLAGLPITLGYFFVAIGIGTYAVRSSISPLQATAMSLANLTSAGEISAISIFASGGGYAQLAIAQAVINIRYALMGISLSQKNFSPSFGMRKKLLASFAITDEIFAALSARQGEITERFAFSLAIGPIAGWTLGTLAGSIAGEAFSKNVSGAMSLLIYAMLISIIVPKAKRSIPSLIAILTSAAISVSMHFTFPNLQPGYSVVISSLAGASIAAALPCKDKDDKIENEKAAYDVHQIQPDNPQTTAAPPNEDQ